MTGNAYSWGDSPLMVASWEKNPWRSALRAGTSPWGMGFWGLVCWVCGNVWTMETRCDGRMSPNGTAVYCGAGMATNTTLQNGREGISGAVSEFPLPRREAAIPAGDDGSVGLQALRAAIDAGDASGIAPPGSFERVRRKLKLSSSCLQ